MDSNRSSRPDYKDVIFNGILQALTRRLDPSRRRLLDVGAHAGRFISLARKEGWAAEGLELNPRTAAYARTADTRDSPAAECARSR